MKTLLGDFHNKPVEHLIEEVLAKYGVQRQVFHSHSLIGEHCHRLLRDNVTILVEIEEILKDPTVRRENVSEDIDDEIGVHLTDLGDLMGSLDIAFSYASRPEPPLTDVESATLKLLCSYIGHLWRRMFKTVPPKLHILETHMPVQAEYFRILGMFTEDPIERMHNEDNQYNRSFERSEKAKHTRSSLEHGPETRAIIEETKGKSKRKMGSESREKKEQADEAKKVRKEDNIAKVLDKAQKCIGNNYRTP
jgi:hypothetical protein